MTPPASPVSDAEAQVMEVLWQSSPRSTDEIAASLQGQREWQIATIKTLLNRLLKKGAVAAEKDGRRYLYSAVLSREAWLSHQSLGLVDRLFNGRLAPLVAHFGAERGLSQADLDALKALVRTYEKAPKP